MRRLNALLLATLAPAFSAAPAFGQQIEVSREGDAEAWVPRDAVIRLLVSRPPTPDEGRLAVLIGNTDLTDVFVLRDGGLEYGPGALPLPPGETEIAVFLVSPSGWNELARLPLRVLSERGFEQTSFAPALDVQGSSVLDEHVQPLGGAATADDGATLNARVEGGYLRNGWRFDGRAHAIGVSKSENALRFGVDGARAPQFDLADYSLRFERADNTRGFVELGHVSQAMHRHLMPSFSSRGSRFGVPLGRSGAATFSAMNGTSIAGWRNFIGLRDREHRIATAGFGFELAPARPGGVRLDIDYLDGSVLPQTGFNAGNIADARTSQAWGLRLNGMTPSGRARVDAGFAASEFRNPFDPTLAQGAELVPVEKETRGARYLDFAWDAVQRKAFGQGRTADLTFALRHERIEPQYATVAAYVQADLEQNVAELSGTLGPVQVLVSGSRAEDNLDDIPSILKTETERASGNFAVALSDLVKERELLARWLPFATYGYDRTHQVGRGVPVSSGFNASHVPDQVSEHTMIGLDWRGGRWSLSYRADRSVQDNRQPGRELADFEHTVRAASVSLMVHERLDLSFEHARERSLAAETNRIDQTRNTGFGFAWRATDKLYLASTAGLTETADEARTNESESTFVDCTFSYRFEWKGRNRGVAGQLFLRYSDVGYLAQDRVFLFDVDNRTRTIVGGFNVSML